MKKNIYDLINSKKITLTFLKDWTFITITGKDCLRYLQNQFTYNLYLLKQNQHVICAHCSINGKVLSVFHLFMYDQGYAYIQKKSISKLQVNELKKYSIFSNINICQNRDTLLIGLIGACVNEKLSKILKNLPDKKSFNHQEKNITVLKFHKPYDRFLIIIKKNNSILKKILELTNEIYHNNIWLALNIMSGFPNINHITYKKFFPQSLNLEKLNALDLKKGCFYGQEMIAKVHFKKLNKYQLYWLIGNAYPKPKIGDNLILKYNKNNYNCGLILSTVNISNSKLWIQAILKKNTNYKNNFVRIKNNINSFFYIKNSTYNIQS